MTVRQASRSSSNVRTTIELLSAIGAQISTLMPNLYSYIGSVHVLLEPVRCDNIGQMCTWQETSDAAIRCPSRSKATQAPKAWGYDSMALSHLRRCATWVLIAWHGCTDVLVRDHLFQPVHPENGFSSESSSSPELAAHKLAISSQEDASSKSAAPEYSQILCNEKEKKASMKICKLRVLHECLLSMWDPDNPTNCISKLEMDLTGLLRTRLLDEMLLQS